MRVRLTERLLQSSKDLSTSKMSREADRVPAIKQVRFRSSAVRTVKVWEDGVKVCESQARGKAVDRSHYAQDMPARAESWFISKCALA